jgi:hypothetical protein
MWLALMYGYDVSWTDLSEVRTWLKDAKEGDVAYMDDSYRLVGPDQGDIEICCTRSVE